MITGDQLEQLCLEWIQTTGCYHIAPVGDSSER